MEKLKELLLMQQIKGFGKVKISRHLDDIRRAESMNQLLDLISTDKKVNTDELKLAREHAEKQYADLLDCKDISIITVFDDEYPASLNIMGDKRPSIIYVKGNMVALNTSGVAVIGTRTPCDWSVKVEERLVKRIIKESDLAIISGLALGCDGIAHETAVKEGRTTIAVLPCGIDDVIPKSHKKLAQSILDTGGCLLSEYAPGMNNSRPGFLERDAIIAALSDITFVVECTIKSGTMHTVNKAYEYGRHIACYYPDNDVLGKNYQGNKYIIDNRNGFKVSDTNELMILLNTYNNSEKEDNMPYSGAPKQTTLFD